jgi:hypothetical protein
MNRLAILALLATAISGVAEAASISIEASGPSDWKVWQTTEHGQVVCSIANNNKPMIEDLPPLILRFDSTQSQMTMWMFGAYQHPTEGTVKITMTVDNNDNVFNIPMNAELNDMRADIRTSDNVSTMFSEFSQGKTLTATVAGKTYTINLAGFAERFGNFQSCATKHG